MSGRQNNGLRRCPRPDPCECGKGALADWAEVGMEPMHGQIQEASSLGLEERKSAKERAHRPPLGSNPSSCAYNVECKLEKMT